jgi:hypothetical protein
MIRNIKFKLNIKDYSNIKYLMALKSEKIFELMTNSLKTNQEAVKKVGAVLHFEIA